MALCSTTTDDTSDGSANNPFILKKGITFNIVNRVEKPVGTPFNLTGWTGRAELRRQNTDVGTPVATFTVTIHPTQTGRADARIGAVQSATNTALKNGELYVFDIEYEHPTDPEEVISGGEAFVQVREGVTKS